LAPSAATSGFDVKLVRFCGYQSYGGQTMDSSAAVSNGAGAEGAAGMEIEAAAAPVEAELD
jgi:hypothetical protein